MRSYLIEDFYPEHLEKIVATLKAKGCSGSLDGIFYLTLPDELLTDVQREHAAECGPHMLVLEVVDEATLKLELLVRAQKKLRCECVMYSTPAQREHIIDYIDDFIRQLDISV
ncbi:MAG TPA: hypothetical protein VN419_09375 [Humidesulfovibrio sp.]|uniref:hypothetical protein n=1 Tax=Humidesulfovibrio sp. TaxID=2910988 RepID=UPI002C1D6099|nr:hypothetical protein [Humidesulfovibrio sp.]HWR04218.1 hypothetical protein [Humidesulfovibrio sp.]